MAHAAQLPASDWASYLLGPEAKGQVAISSKSHSLVLLGAFLMRDAQLSSLLPVKGRTFLQATWSHFLTGCSFEEMHVYIHWCSIHEISWPKQLGRGKQQVKVGCGGMHGLKAQCSPC